MQGWPAAHPQPPKWSSANPRSHSASDSARVPHAAPPPASRSSTHFRLKQVALSKLASFIAAYDNPRLAELKEAFSSKDDAGNLTGKVPYHKVERVLKNGEFQLSDLEVRQLLSSFHVDSEGNIDINEWLAALIDWREVQSTDQWDALISRVFDTFDLDHSGRLGAAELESLLCDEEVGCLVEDTVPAAMRAAEVDSMTSIDYPADASSNGAAEGGQASNAGQASNDGRGLGGAECSPREHQQRQQKQQLPVSKSPWDGGGIDLPAFAKLLRTAQHDKLELYDSRRVKRE
uniref:EF-hand domain-containing protein n=1 Tax=Dunaliella tertiolecta TaxID=3047 RepID=A0A7S3QUL7_DUNTE